MNWILIRMKYEHLDQVKAMLDLDTPLEETQGYKDLVQIGFNKGILEGELKGELKNLRK